MRNITVAVPFVRTEADQNPNMKAADTSDQQAAYWRSMVVTLASFRRWNPGTRLQVISNAPIPGWVEPQLKDLDVRLRPVDFTHRAPAGFSPVFAGALYLLDAVDAQKPDEDLLLVDPDVLCLRPLEGLVEHCGGECGVIRLETAADHPNNGLSLAAARAIHAQLGASDDLPTHIGGEFLYIPASRGQEVRKLADQAWAEALEAHGRGQSHMTTEEHVLTYVFSRLDAVDLAGFVKRMWTTAKVRTVESSDRQLTCWHLPAEKERGFKEIYPECLDRGSWFWMDEIDSFVQKSGVAMGLWGRRGQRLMRDAAGSVASGRWLHTTVGPLGRRDAIAGVLSHAGGVIQMLSNRAERLFHRE